jgi:hypothetical protein
MYEVICEDIGAEPRGHAAISKGRREVLARIQASKAGGVERQNKASIHEGTTRGLAMKRAMKQGVFASKAAEISV